mgnify:CR=1 FL=1
MFYNRSIKLLMAILMLFLFSCNQENTSSGESSSSSYASSSCKLDKMCDEYQGLADQIIRATKSNNYTSLMQVNQNVQGWLSRWETAINSNSCTTDEVLEATNRMLSIANSLISSY